jgi:hypothetical protein
MKSVRRDQAAAKSKRESSRAGEVAPGQASLPGVELEVSSASSQASERTERELRKSGSGEPASGIEPEPPGYKTGARPIELHGQGACGPASRGALSLGLAVGGCKSPLSIFFWTAGMMERFHPSEKAVVFV